jgi:3-methyladenine DNA glycosylase/8-oxoguanine DNA glycosylase
MERAISGIEMVKNGEYMRTVHLELLKMAEAWRPWRSYATVNPWNTL